MKRFIDKVYIYIKTYWIYFYFIFSLIYFELFYRLFTLGHAFSQISIPIIAILVLSTIGIFFTRLFSENINKILVYSIISLNTLIYLFYFVYYTIFKATFSIYSFKGTKDVLEFRNVAFNAITNNILGCLIFLIPLIVLVILSRKLLFNKSSIKEKAIQVCCLLILLVSLVTMLNIEKNRTNSVMSLVKNQTSRELLVHKVGLIPSFQVDIVKTLIKVPVIEMKAETINAIKTEKKIIPSVEYSIIEKPLIIPKFEERIRLEEEKKELPYNIDERIDFESLISNEGSDKLKQMHQYFSVTRPTKQNEYTGMFEGYNLILLTAEAFFPYAVDEKLTPMLYKMANEGFVFNNFYTPLWGVSTSDGEYVALTGNYPKRGVWSMSKSSKNWLPYVLGNQFSKLGYLTKAYHDHTYDYYDRDKSHPNLGYEYKGVGSGLDIEVLWPESDLDMIEATYEEYINNEPFHVYMMTVSGHLQYNFGGNHMAAKNRKYVEELNYSTPAKAYIACNMELEFAMQSLVKHLEEANILDKTVIAISPDHYPYGLSTKTISELIGHQVETNFERFKGIFILWNSEMERIEVDELCQSADILPTLSNLFGIKYDSRLMMGRDIFSEHEIIIPFENHSFLTERVKYNAVTNEAVFFDGEEDENYLEEIKKKVENMFLYSTWILEEDYYKKVLGDS